VGQPRDRNPAASWVLYDTDSRLVRYRRVDYDVHTAASAIRARGLPPFLAERLLYGI
jgi:diadenosine tetraphosphatase ApaH/serine/threonine PP2A family protein phosphatase